VKNWGQRPDVFLINLPRPLLPRQQRGVEELCSQLSLTVTQAREKSGYRAEREILAHGISMASWPCWFGACGRECMVEPSSSPHANWEVKEKREKE
jgi:hypothetical protein